MTSITQLVINAIWLSYVGEDVGAYFIGLSPEARKDLYAKLESAKDISPTSNVICMVEETSYKPKCVCGHPFLDHYYGRAPCVNGCNCSCDAYSGHEKHCMGCKCVRYVRSWYYSRDEYYSKYEPPGSYGLCWLPAGFGLNCTREIDHEGQCNPREDDEED